jgi:hypothetical protein
MILWNVSLLETLNLCPQILINTLNIVNHHRASFALSNITDNFLVILDLDKGRTITNEPAGVVSRLNLAIAGGIGKRKIYYLDTCGRFDELTHQYGVFCSILPCTDSQQAFFQNLIKTTEPSMVDY